MANTSETRQLFSHPVPQSGLAVKLAPPTRCRLKCNSVPATMGPLTFLQLEWKRVNPQSYDWGKHLHVLKA